MLITIAIMNIIVDFTN